MFGIFTIIFLILLHFNLFISSRTLNFVDVTLLISSYLSSLVSIVWCTIVLDFLCGHSDHLLFQAQKSTAASWRITVITIIPAIHSRYSKQGNLLGDQVQAETQALMKYEMLPLGTSLNLIMHLVKLCTWSVSGWNSLYGALQSLVSSLKKQFDSEVWASHLQFTAQLKYPNQG